MTAPELATAPTSTRHVGRAPRRGVGRWVRRAVLLTVAVALLVPALTAVRIWQFARTDARPPSAVILVLGAAQFNGRPSEIFEGRLRHAQALYLQGVAPTLVTMGGGLQGDRTTEAEAGRAWLLEHNVPSSAVLAVAAGTSTLSSLQAAQPVLAKNGWDTAVVVTDPWHALRATTMAQDQGLQAHSSPTRSGPSVRDRDTQLRYIARETVAYLYYRLGGGSPDAGPRAV